MRTFQDSKKRQLFALLEDMMEEPESTIAEQREIIKKQQAKINSLEKLLAAVGMTDDE